MSQSQLPDTRPTAPLMPTAGLDAIMERVLMTGDLKDLTPPQRLEYYARLCQSLNLNPLTRPFEYFLLQGKLVLYPKSTATDQIRHRAHISIEILDDSLRDDLYIVRCRGTDPQGVQDEAVGVVALAGAKGQARGDLMMKAHTKARRRLTLAMVGLGHMGEYEDGPLRHVAVSYQTGEVFEPIGAQNTEESSPAGDLPPAQAPQAEPVPDPPRQKPPHPLESAGFDRSMVWGLTRWVGARVQGAWPSDRVASAQALAQALILSAKHGAPIDELIRLCREVWDQQPWSSAVAEALRGSIASLDAGEPPTDARPALPTDLPETLPW